jgi:hypothetical protein
MRPPQLRGEGRGVRPVTRVRHESCLDRSDERARRGRRQQPERRPLPRHRRAEHAAALDPSCGGLPASMWWQTAASAHTSAAGSGAPPRGDRGVDVLRRAVDGPSLLSRDPGHAEVRQQRHPVAVNSTLDGVTSPWTRPARVGGCERLRRAARRRHDLARVERTAAGQQGRQRAAGGVVEDQHRVGPEPTTSRSRTTYGVSSVGQQRRPPGAAPRRPRGPRPGAAA